jgi:hypothetical protein
MNSPRIEKPVLPQNNHMSNMVLKATAINAIKTAALISCEHHKEQAIEDACRRLQESEMNPTKIQDILEKISFKPKNKNIEREDEYRAHTTINYHHGFSHRTQRMARNYRTRIHFKYRTKYSKLPQKFNKYANQKRNRKTHFCNHSKNYMSKCTENVVYLIKLKCGKIYIGETGRCINTRIEEHIGNLKNIKSKDTDPKYASLSSHAKICKGCQINFQQCRILYSGIKNPTVRKLIEGYEILGAKNNLSKLSLKPTEEEIRFLKKSGYID